MQLLQISRDTVGGARTADSAGLSITDNLDLRARVIMAKWRPAGNENTFVSKRQGGDEWQFRTQDITGRLQFLWWDTGGVESVETADADVPMADGTTAWVRVRRSGTAVNFWYSTTDTNDHTAVSWTALGTTQTTPAGSIRSTVGTFITVGTAYPFAGGESLDGYIYTAAIVDNVTTRANPDFTNTAQWTVGDGTGTSGVDQQGNTWTLWDAGLIVGDNLGKIPGVIVSVAAAFGSGFASIGGQLQASLDWYDITTDVRSIHTERGKQYELDRIDQGIATLELENFDGKYNAHNTTSPYYPNVKPMVPIRIRAIYDGTLYPIWSGFVERWPVSTTDMDSLVSVQCADLFKALAMADVAQANRTAAVEALNPVAWWRFEDNTDSVGGHDLTYAGTPTEGVAGVWAGDFATTFDGTSEMATVANEVDVERDGIARTWEVWAKPDIADAASRYVFSVDTGGGIPVLINLFWNGSSDSWNVLWQLTPFISGFLYAPGTPGEWAHIVITDTALAPVRRDLYLNGVFNGAMQFGDSFPGHPWDVAIGGTGGGVGAGNLWKGDISEIVVYPTALTASQVQTLYAAQFEAFQTQLTSERINYVLAESDFLGAPITTVDLETGLTVMSGINSPTDVTALEAIQQATDTERGWFYIAADGSPTFRNRHYRTLQQTTPIATVDESDYDFVQAGVDEELLANDIQVGTPDVTFQARDDASIDEFGRRTLEFTIYPEDQNEGYDYAFYLLSQFANPETRISSLDFKVVEVSPLDTLLAAELGNRYNIEVPLSGDDLDLDTYLEKITHDISLDKQWTTQWQLSPASSDQFWLMGVAGFSEVGETTVFGY